MSQAIYLSPKSAGVATVIYIRSNRHNPRGYIETSRGRAIKLNGDVNGKSNSKTNY